MERIIRFAAHRLQTMVVRQEYQPLSGRGLLAEKRQLVVVEVAVHVAPLPRGRPRGVEADDASDITVGPGLVEFFGDERERYLSQYVSGTDAFFWRTLAATD